MKFTPTDALPEILIIEPDVYPDERGFFLETWHAEKYAEGGVEAPFVQDNHSRSTRGILRGLHAQLARPQGKLVRASVGEIYDVAVDIRHGSPTFGTHVGVLLSEDNYRQLWIPAGFAHGFCVTSDVAELQYKMHRSLRPKLRDHRRLERSRTRHRLARRRAAALGKRCRRPRPHGLLRKRAAPLHWIVRRHRAARPV